MSLAPVDELRSLPPAVAAGVLARLEAELGPEAVAALDFNFRFWARPAQRFPHPDEEWATLVYVGEFGTGKTWVAQQLFVHLILTRQAKLPRIICATGPAVQGTVIDGPSGIRAWLPPGIRCEYRSSKGHEGELWLDGVRVACCSADAPGQMIGEGSDLDLRDDVAKWVVTLGLAGARRAWAAAGKSCRENLSRAIVPTTPDGGAFVADLMNGQTSGVLTIDLGQASENRGNLGRNYIEHTIPNLKAQGLWDTGVSPSPFAPVEFEKLRVTTCPPLVELAVALDPARSSGARACKCGIVGGGRDARSAVHVRYNRSAVLSSGVNGWPSVAWDLLETLQLEHPGVPIHFVLESNTGKEGNEALLRGEERERRLLAGKPGVSVVEIRHVRAEKDKCKRAESPARLALQAQVRFAPLLGDLEGQLRGLTPDGTDSDDADACVHLVNDLAGLGAVGAPPPTDPRLAFEGFTAAQRRMPAPTIERGGRDRGDRTA